MVVRINMFYGLGVQNPNEKSEGKYKGCKRTYSNSRKEKFKPRDTTKMINTIKFLNLRL